MFSAAVALKLVPEMVMVAPFAAAVGVKFNEAGPTGGVGGGGNSLAWQMDASVIIPHGRNNRNKSLPKVKKRFCILIFLWTG